MEHHSRSNSEQNKKAFFFALHGNCFLENLVPLMIARISLCLYLKQSKNLGHLIVTRTAGISARFFGKPLEPDVALRGQDWPAHCRMPSSAGSLPLNGSDLQSLWQQQTVLTNFQNLLPGGHGPGEMPALLAKALAPPGFAHYTQEVTVLIRGVRSQLLLQTWLCVIVGHLGVPRSQKVGTIQGCDSWPCAPKANVLSPWKC